MNDFDTIRRIKNKTGGFTIVLNEVFRRTDLSARAKGLYGYIMTLPDTWEIYREELFTHFTEGRNAMDTAFKELRDTGYIKRIEVRDERGTFAGYKYIVYESAPEVPDPDKPPEYIKRIEVRDAAGTLTGYTYETGESSRVQPLPGFPSAVFREAAEPPFPGKPFPGKPFPQKPFPGNQQLLITDLSNNVSKPITHTQDPRAGEKNEHKSPEQKPQPEAPPDPPLLRHRYPKIDIHALYREIKAAGFPDPGGEYRLSILMRDILPYFDGLVWEDIIAAIQNYAKVKQKPGSWWDSNPNIFYWAQKHLTNFLPVNFRIEDYVKADKREEDPENKAEAERRRRLEAEVLGGSHGTG